jgi:hypothetical protein
LVFGFGRKIIVILPTRKTFYTARPALPAKAPQAPPESARFYLLIGGKL